jgi:phosphoribosylformylglycinamidine synthase
MDILRQFDLSRVTYEIGTLNPRDQIEIYRDAICIYQQPRAQLQRLWSSVSYEIAVRRDAPDLVEQEYAGFGPTDEPVIRLPEGFPRAAQAPSLAHRPKVAILREQGVNGQVEMAAAFDRAGFEAWDVHMSDLLEGRVQLSEFAGLAACGGFSFGDVLGAGRGWARSILFHDALRQQFEAFFADQSRFALGVCNGCQMVSALKEIIPGAQDWPTFEKNRSEQFEARLAQVEVLESPSVFLSGFAGAVLPVVVSHGEGRAVFASDQALTRAKPVLRYVDAQGHATETYPMNPNGSAQGVTGFTNQDGRITLMMPHPERVFRAVQMSWQPNRLAMSGVASPWLQMFLNARHWVKSA